MRSRTQSSSARVTYFTRLVSKTILHRQSPITGLIPSIENLPDAWIRDNVYSVLAVWALSIVYKKRSDSEVDRAKAYEFEQCVVKNLRGLLKCFMLQQNKLERFKHSQNALDCFHAKYDSRDCNTVVGDKEWGHLQMDAVSLFLLILAEATTAGLNIIQTLDEVAFIQNLVFYIEAAYRIPDYGIWERGDKTNHGLPELNASSVGMAHAALRALDGLNLFGAQGGSASLIHTLPDEASMCYAVLSSMLPRESVSKETDSAILSAIGFPAFSLDDNMLVENTINDIAMKLEGKYGYKRFMRDGYKTAKEDPNRLYYEPHELKAFENIECEWPLFYVYRALNALFNSGTEDSTDPSTELGTVAKRYLEKVESLMVYKDDLKVIPEMYQVPLDKVSAECSEPGSQERMPVGRIPHVWTQSLYVVAALVAERFLSPGELDPLSRRMVAHRPSEVVTQIVLLAEDESIKEKVSFHGVTCQTLEEVAPIHIYNARVLSYLYSHLGKNNRLGLTGRASAEIGVLATSKLYLLHNEIFAFQPSFLDERVFYMGQDAEYLLDMFSVTVAYLNQHWTMLGRPTVVVTLSRRLMDHSEAFRETMIGTLRNLQSGIISGQRVQVGYLKDFISTSNMTRLSFLEHSDEFSDKSFHRYLSKYSNQAAVSRLATTEATHTDDEAFSPTGGSVVRKKSEVAKKFQGFVSKRRMSLYKRPGSKETQKDPSTSGEESAGLLSPTQPAERSFTVGRPSTDMTLEDFVAMTENQTIEHYHLARPAAGHLDSPSAPNLTHLAQKQKFRPTNLLTNKSSSSQYLVGNESEKIDVDEIVDSLKVTSDLTEQADLVQGLYMAKGLDWMTPLGCTVKDLIAEVGERASEMREWWLVRHTNGVLRRRPQDLAKCLTDLLVRGKQVSLGLPPESTEKVITRPLPPDELETIIWNSCHKDPILTVLTQELLVDLSMLARSEKLLFSHMIRLRVGLITQVMASELAALLNSSPEEATFQLFSLSPYQVKTLLYRVISGSELVKKGKSSDMTTVSVGKLVTDKVSKRSFTRRMASNLPLTPSTGGPFTFERQNSQKSSGTSATTTPASSDSEEDLDVEDIITRGQWFRRRRLDGALNRVPIGFYAGVWNLLNRCDAIIVYGRALHSSLTREMTQQELKFALMVETALNRIPDPNYRQLFVEAVSVLSTLAEHDHGITRFHTHVQVDGLISAANDLFLSDQEVMPGSSARVCCANEQGLKFRRDQSRHGVEKPTTPICHGPSGICAYFYDSAPSGKFGTLSYLARAVTHALTIPTVPESDIIDCNIS